MFIAQLRKPYIPGTDMTVDEQSLLFRVKCTFKQYVPSKPAKCGINIWWNCNASTTYPLNGQVYLGRHIGEVREVNQGG